MGPEYQLPQNRFRPPDKKPEPIPIPQHHQPLAPDANPYGFITNAPHQSKRARPNIKNGSLRSRLLLIVGGGLVLIILIIVFSNILNGSKRANSTLLTSLAAEQQEIIRIAALGSASVTDPSVGAFATTAKSSVTSDQASLIAYLKTKNVRVTNAEINIQKDTSTDKAFDNAKANNNYDAVFSAKLKSSLTTYVKDIKKNYSRASNPTSKKLLSDSYNSATQLLK